jgi:Ser/Thr protein kinase RdoA (MazF antagonist)
LKGYAAVRPLPAGHAARLEALFVLRRMQILVWVLESRGHPAFRDSWWPWVREELDAISC